MSKKEVKFNCKIVKCMFNSENYKIYATEVDKEKYPNIKHNKYDNVTIYGDVHNLVVSQSYEVTAAEQLDKYGYGYDIVNVRMDRPKNEEEVYMFLREILTENQAGVLWQHYPDIIDIVLRDEADTVDLDQLKGIGEKTFETIKTKIIENYCIYDLVVEFGGILTMSMLKKLYDKFRSIPKLKQELKISPYRSLTQISGIGFIKADSILLELQRLGKIDFPFDLKSSAQRCAACMEYYLEENQKEGNTKMDLRDLRKQVVKLVPACSSHYVECLKDPDIYYNKETFEVALKVTHDTEAQIAAALFVANNNPQIWDFDWKSYQDAGEYSLTDEQTSALECICNNNIMILNGFAGSGKSATSAMIIKMLEDNDISYTLMAPTGRAAKVLSDYTGRPAATIHRGLGYMPNNKWGYDNYQKLPFDVVLVDEFSMTDVFLFLHLCDAIDFSKTKLVVVGDSAQLPSVGPGNLLYDLINSFVIPTVTLNQIFRYAEGGLMKVATDVRNMKPYLYDLNNGVAKFGKDYTFINVDNEQLVKCAIRLYQKLLTKYSPADILVLSAFNKGACGTVAINNAIQKIANSNYGSEKCIKSGDTTYYVDDIIIQIKNNYEAEVDMDDMKIENTNPDEVSINTTFIPNGMLGKIVDIYDEIIPYTNEHRTGAIIDFDGIRVKYEKSEMSMLLLGYAISIHKSQGGSAKVTITLTPSCHSYMMNSNLLYVALTRTKEEGFHLGDKNTVNKAIKKKENFKRNTFLLSILKKLEKIKLTSKEKSV